MPAWFSFYSPEGERLFYKKLRPGRCQGQTAGGRRCSRTCIQPFEYCPAHLKSNLHLRVGPSTIPNAGKGLFAWDPTREIVFRKGDIIVPYRGESVTEDEIEGRYGEYTAPYAVKVNRNRIIDASAHRGVGSLANTNPRHNNGTITAAPSLKATSNIRHDEEIFISYGRDYRLPDQEGIRYVTKSYPTKS